MPENLARDDLDRLIRAGFAPQLRPDGSGMWWVKDATGLPVPVSDLAAVLLAGDPGALSRVLVRLQEAAQLGLAAGGGG